MKKQRQLRLIEVLVVIAIIAMLIAIFMPAQGRIKPIAQRVVCGTNLKGLGNAITFYGKEYDGHYPCLPGEGPWSKELGFDYYNPKPDFTGAQANTSRTVSASLYLLVRLADVSPKTFTCPESDQMPFDGRNPGNWDIVELWDFGNNPYECVSYVYQNPYGKYSATDKLSDTFAIMADMNPWFCDGDIVIKNPIQTLPPQIIQYDNEKKGVLGNSTNHTRYDIFGIFSKRKDHGIGQNVLRADGHTSFEKAPNVGVNQDNIYTFWSAEENPSKQDIEGGTAPTERNQENDAKSEEDSFLVI